MIQIWSSPIEKSWAPSLITRFLEIIALVTEFLHYGHVYDILIIILEQLEHVTMCSQGKNYTVQSFLLQTAHLGYLSFISEDIFKANSSGFRWRPILSKLSILSPSMPFLFPPFT